jgi:CHAT domain-containing protein
LSPEALAQALPQQSLLVHFVRYPVFEFVAADRSGDKITYASWRKGRLSQQYGAFCLSRTAQGVRELRFVGLGHTTQLDSLIATYRRSIESVTVTGWPTARDEALYRAAARELYQRVWAPLMATAERIRESPEVETDVRTVFIVPASHLHLVDFNTLLSPAGDLVIERWKPHLLSSAMDLLRISGNPVRSEGRGLLAVGNPDCHSRDAEATRHRQRAEHRSTASPCLEGLRSPGPLPGAEDEARAVCQLYSGIISEPATLLVGPDATEDVIKRLLPHMRIAHLATHGFFCDAEKSRSPSSGYDLTNPLLLSGLVFAPGGEGNDGLLTALEIVGHDLRNLDWVVLSACGTGLGGFLPFSGEGPIGLRRAFEIAGARTVVMALWRIRDSVSRDLMEEVYRKRLGGSSTVDAIRQAQLERLGEQRNRFNRIHPSLWGGIVAQGDWR